MDKFKRFHRAVNFVEKIDNISDDIWPKTKITPELRLKRMKYFLNLLGNPQKNYKVIHVAGTSGKGSVSHLLQQVLTASGYKVGSFCTPYLTSAIDVIKVGDLFISPDEYADILDYLKPYIEKSYVKGFEGKAPYTAIYIAIALEYFKRKKCDWVILETTSGGFSSSTCAVDNAVASIITNVGYDHTTTLGKTLNKIAKDKSGIIKKNSIFWTAETRPRILNLFKEVCKNQKTQFNKIEKQDNYKITNEKLVESVCKSLGIDEKYILAGIKNFKIAGRFEVIQKNPVIVIDVAHNKDKMASTAHNLKQIKYKKLNLIIALGEKKDKYEILKQIIPYATNIYFTRFEMSKHRCANPLELQKTAKEFLKKGAKTYILFDPMQALDKALKNTSKEDALLITGSFFLAGDLRQKWFSEEYILKHRKNF